MKKTWISAFGFIILMDISVAWTAPVPDTGQMKCYNATVEIPCPPPAKAIGVKVFLKKPVATGDLAEMVRKVLDEAK